VAVQRPRWRRGRRPVRWRRTRPDGCFSCTTCLRRELPTRRGHGLPACDDLRRHQVAPVPRSHRPRPPHRAPGGRFAHGTVADGAWRSAVDGGVPRNAGLGVHGGDGADARYVGDGRAPTAVSRARRASGGSSLRDVAMGSPPATTCDVTRLRPSPALIAPVRPTGLPGDDSRMGRSPMGPGGVPWMAASRGTPVWESTVETGQTPGTLATDAPRRLLRVHIVPPAGAPYATWPWAPRLRRPATSPGCDRPPLSSPPSAPQGSRGTIRA
jgi:hypothetical protein